MYVFRSVYFSVCMCIHVYRMTVYSNVHTCIYIYVYRGVYSEFICIYSWTPHPVPMLAEMVFHSVVPSLIS